MNRSIKRIAHADPVNMGGIKIDQALPLSDLEQIDPFLLIHHWRDDFPGGQKQKDLGVGPHPHRGFAPVTLIFEGAVHHRDSEGYDSIVEAGGTQWMNSGKGIIHSERPSKKIAEEGGLYEIIQFWVNAPASHKLDQPFYQALAKEETPEILSDDGRAKIYVVAGQLNGKKSKIESYSPMTILRMEFEKDGKASIEIPKEYNALLYVLNGNLQYGPQLVPSKSMAVFNNDGTNLELEATEKTRAIILSGAPINEPLATYGPFVMNNSRELTAAIQDYQEGKMGRLVEEFV